VEPTTDVREGEDQTPVPDESKGQEIINPDYQLTRDRTRRQINPPEIYGYADLICCALNAAEEVQDSEPMKARTG